MALYFSPSFLLSDATTGIRELEVPQQTSDDHYNLAGRRVDKSHRGLVIYKGRKYLSIR